MLVDSRAPASSGAPRAAVESWAAPLLIANIVTTTPLHQALWSESAERHEEQLAGLSEDDERVAGVLEALGPTDVQQCAQARAVRAEANEASAGRAMRREDAQQQSLKSGGSFRAALSNARSESTGHPSATPIGGSNATTQAQTPPSTANLLTAATQVESGNDAAQSAAERPAPAGSATSPAPPGASTAASPSPNSPSAILAAVGAGVSRAPAVSGQSAVATTVGLTPRVETAAVGAPNPASSGSSTSPTGAAGPVGSDGASDTANRVEPASERDAEQSPPDADDRAENVERVLRVLRGSLARQRTTTVIRMDPPELGALRLELDLRKDVLTLRMSAETDAAQQLLRDQLDTLRSGLEAAGIRLERVEVLPLVPLRDGSPFGAFAESGERRGESSRESSDRPAAPSVKPRGEGSSSGQQRVEPSPLAPAMLGPARLNVVA